MSAAPFYYFTIKKPFKAPLDGDIAFGPVAIDNLGDMMRETKSRHSGVMGAYYSDTEGVVGGHGAIACLDVDEDAQSVSVDGSFQTRY